MALSCAISMGNFSIWPFMDFMEKKLQTIAARFDLVDEIAEIRLLETGNVNDTYLVTLQDGGRRILQRLNARVFRHPEQVMANLRVVHDHLHRQLGREQGGRWDVPEIHVCPDGSDYVLDDEDGFWRLLGYIEGARTYDNVQDSRHAQEAGRALGLFHRLLSRLAPERLNDVLPGFHVTPTYLAAYDGIGEGCRPQTEDSHWCRQFIESHRDLAPVLEEACARGELQVQPIHGDPKVNNIMICEETGRAVALIDLDTVKPGLIQYDLGDCLRSCCNPEGEEAVDPGSVHFDLDFCRAILTGYLDEAKAFLTEADLRYIFAAARLMAFELGLRFFADWLTGDHYFKTADEEHNLRRALIQFRLTADIERQEAEINSLLAELT
jgi:Ser/Thr protein kinase RdoA (MazF antagonist)